MRKLLLGGLALLLTGCAHDSWNYQAVPNIMLVPSDNLSSSGPVRLRTEPSDTLVARPADEKSAASAKTVLIASWKHDLGTYRSSVGKTLIVTLDGPPKIGQYWLTPDNAVLVSYSAYSAQRERVNVVGSIKVKSISGNQIVADVAVKDVEDVDSSGFIDHPYDAQYRQWPFSMTGERKFVVTSPGDPTIDKSAVKWEVQ